jgi:hypothetical protein
MPAVTQVALKRLMLAETQVTGIHVPRRRATTPNYALILAEKLRPGLGHAWLPPPLVLRTHVCPALRKRPPERSPLMKRLSSARPARGLPARDVDPGEAQRPWRALLPRTGLHWRLRFRDPQAAYRSLWQQAARGMTPSSGRSRWALWLLLLQVGA